MNEKTKQHIKKYECVSPRLLWVKMKVGIRRLFIIACYAPVDSEISDVKHAFWESLNDILGARDPGERIILLGDMNGWVGMKREGPDRVLGQFGDPKANGNGERLISLCLENGLFRRLAWDKNGRK